MSGRSLSGPADVQLEASPGQPPVSAAVRDQFLGAKGLEMTYWVDSSGHVRDVRIVASGAAPSSSKQLAMTKRAMESMATTLPTQPIGLGAKWQVINRTEEGGIQAISAVTYTLTTDSPTRLTLETTGQMLLVGEADKPAAIRSWHHTQSGNLVLDLTKVAPDTAMDLATDEMSLPRDPSAASPADASKGGEGISKTSYQRRVTRW